MEPLVDTIIEDGRWDDFGLPELAAKAASATLADLGLPGTGLTFCLMGCDDARIAVLNSDFRGKAGATNVLSWPSVERGGPALGATPPPPVPGTIDEPEELGDIAIAFETCMAEANALGRPISAHVTHLVVHGLLHLLGYDHVTDEDAALMETTETRILASMGIADPY